MSKILSLAKTTSYIALLAIHVYLFILLKLCLHFDIFVLQLTEKPGQYTEFVLLLACHFVQPPSVGFDYCLRSTGLPLVESIIMKIKEINFNTAIYI